jgi:ElaB/YqjD/DUF883 family membrane-anchored ribosome-binding protein
MSLPFKNSNSGLPENPGPKILPMPAYDPDVDLEDLAAEEVEFVLRRASDALAGGAQPLHDLGKRVTSAYDRAMQRAAASSRHGIQALRNLADQQPVRFIAVAAVAGFAVGFTLRIWRSSRA